MGNIFSLPTRTDVPLAFAGSQRSHNGICEDHNEVQTTEHKSGLQNERGIPTDSNMRVGGHNNLSLELDGIIHTIRCIEMRYSRNHPKMLDIIDTMSALRAQVVNIKRQSDKHSFQARTMRAFESHDVSAAEASADSQNQSSCTLQADAMQPSLDSLTELPRELCSLRTEIQGLRSVLEELVTTLQDLKLPPAQNPSTVQNCSSAAGEVQRDVASDEAAYQGIYAENHRYSPLSDNSSHPYDQWPKAISPNTAESYGVIEVLASHDADASEPFFSIVKDPAIGRSGGLVQQLAVPFAEANEFLTVSSSNFRPKKRKRAVTTVSTTRMPVGGFNEHQFTSDGIAELPLPSSSNIYARMR